MVHHFYVAEMILVVTCITDKMVNLKRDVPISVSLDISTLTRMASIVTFVENVKSGSVTKYCVL